VSKFDWYILTVLFIGAGLPALYFFYIARLVSNQPILLFLCGVILILVGVHGLDLLVALKTPIADMKPGEVLTEKMMNDLEVNNEVWTYIFPIATAAIGANLISTAITMNSVPASDLSRELSQAQEVSGNLRAVTRAMIFVTVLAFLSSLLYFVASIFRI